jgi:hypothetical protein
MLFYINKIMKTLTATNYKECLFNNGTQIPGRNVWSESCST